MFNQTFYHGTIENYVKIFSRIFQNIEIKRRDVEGNVTQTLPIPLVYGYKDAQLAQVLQDIDKDRKIQVTLPRMAFIWNGDLTADYDSRGLHPLSRIISKDKTSPDLVLSHYQFVPYKMSFTLSLMVNKVKDGTQLIEQIVPFFTPDFHITVNLIPGFKHQDDIEVILDGINADHQSKGDVTSNNVMVWDLNFTMKVKFYGPVHKSGLIKHIMVDINKNQHIDITPGLSIDGNPTSDPDETIDINQINADDPWGIIKQFRETL